MTASESQTKSFDFVTFSLEKDSDVRLLCCFLQERASFIQFLFSETFPSQIPHKDRINLKSKQTVEVERMAHQRTDLTGKSNGNQSTMYSL